MFVSFFFNDTATTEIYTCCHTLSLHDARPICIIGAFARRAADHHAARRFERGLLQRLERPDRARTFDQAEDEHRSEEHTSELQSLMRISYAVFCLKKKKITKTKPTLTVTPKLTIP